MKTSTFYNPRLDNPSNEENFLLKRRIRLMKKLKALVGINSREANFQRPRLEKKLAETDKKLGIK